jgi:hypothetical protein
VDVAQFGVNHVKFCVHVYVVMMCWFMFCLCAHVIDA